MSIPARTVFEFGEFIMDTGQRHLVRRASGQMMPLSPKVTDTLIYLLEHGDELLDKGTLLAAIWPNAVVEENSLTQTISTLRRVLGEARGENRYIVTIPGRGYRFVAAIQAIGGGRWERVARARNDRDLDCRFECSGGADGLSAELSASVLHA